VDLGELVRAVVDDMETLRGRVVSVHAPSLQAEVDVPKVERIVEALAANTARYTDDDAHVWIDVRGDDQGGVVISVDDDGEGVPDHLKARIFEPFEQARIVQHSPGVGIGLSIAAQFARLHGGMARVEDRPGGGASFKRYLPLTSSRRKISA
jgi:signal transduction histidine kinase